MAAVCKDSREQQPRIPRFRATCSSGLVYIAMAVV